MNEMAYLESRIKEIILNLSASDLPANYRKNQENALAFYIEQARQKTKSKS